MLKTSLPLELAVCGVQHFSLYNGPGIRTTVFFKGCPLRCAWCCNPETQRNEINILYDKYACIGIEKCGKCIDICPNKAIYKSFDQTIGFARDLCKNCFACTKICPSRAFKPDGDLLQLDEIVQRILVDADYIRENGGVTLSGGEPFMRPKAAAALLEICKEHELHTAVETCGFFDLDNTDLLKALKYTDILYYDIKHLDSAKHKQETSVDNVRITSNLQRLSREFPQVQIKVRTLIVPDFNDNIDDFRQIARFVKGLDSDISLEIMPCSTLCSEKYMQLGLPIPYAFMSRLERGFGEKCKQIAEELSLKIDILS